LQTCRVIKQEALSVVEYAELMMDMIDEIPDKRFRALKEIKKKRLKVARPYNKKVRKKPF
jgi:hypothetical protein